MSRLNIQLPVLDARHHVEIEIRINGNNKRRQYRLEILPWENASGSERKVARLQELVNRYGPGWQLVQIGEANEKEAHVLFRRSESVLNNT